MPQFHRTLHVLEEVVSMVEALLTFYPVQRPDPNGLPSYLHANCITFLRYLLNKVHPLIAGDDVPVYIEVSCSTNSDALRADPSETPEACCLLWTLW